MSLYTGVDIGIKNLAICIIDPEQWGRYRDDPDEIDPGIKLWKNINLLDEAKKCDGVTKKGASCGKLAKWSSKKDHFCGMHKHSDCKEYKQPRVKGTPLKEFKRRMFIELDKIDLFNDVKYIAVETQPRFNQQMKMFAASLESYFIIRQLVDRDRKNGIQMCNSPAKNKLMVYDGPHISTGHIRDQYACRKFLAQKHVEYFLERCPLVLDEFYTNESKKDDLADAFLHCISAIHKKY